ncbi:MAG: hypothetical protein WC254_00415 [Candidatus Woesearchaeota archaeon]|jgi:hypothetical protein
MTTIEDTIATEIQKINGLLSNVTVEEDAVITLYTPITITHAFEALPDGNISYKKEELYWTPTIRKNTTPEHTQAFYQEIEKRINGYTQIVEKNKRISKAYQTPTFTKEEAEIIAKEAFEVTFWKTKESYKKNN